MTDLQKLDLACTANKGMELRKNITVNQAYIMAGLVEYVIQFFHNKDMGKNGMVKAATYKDAKKAGKSLSKKGYFGEIHAYEKNSMNLLAFKLWGFGR
jgi:hypothetical protein